LQLEPAFFTEVNKHAAYNYKHESHHYEIAVLCSKLRHVVEVHSVDTHDKSERNEDGRDNHLRVKNQDATTANAGAHLVGDTYSLSHTTHPLVHRSVSFAKNNNEGEEEDKNRDKINQSKNISALIQGNIAASSSMNDAGGAEMVGEDNNDEEEEVEYDPFN
jgi:hypothetical protein